MREFLNYVSCGGKTQPKWVTLFPGLGFWTVYKGESMLSASICLSLLSTADAT